MSLPGNSFNNYSNNHSPIVDNKKSLSLPTSNNERNFEDFLREMNDNNIQSSDIESNSGSITIKDQVSNHSSLPSMPEIILNSDKDISKILENNPDLQDTHPIEKSNSNRSSRNNYISQLPLTENIENAGINLFYNNAASADLNQINQDNYEKIATPTINFIKTSEKSTDHENESIFVNQSLECQAFSNKLTKMNELIQQKDEEIKKLSKKLQKMKLMNHSQKKLSELSKSSSSDELCKLSIKSDDNKKQKIKKAKSGLSKKKLKIDSKTSNEASNDAESENSKENNQHLNNKSQSLNNISIVDKDINSTLVQNNETEVDKNKSPPPLRKKLDELEHEVRRLQQANVDSILILEKLQHNNVSARDVSNETVINQLLVDHSLLKEELQQLKWEHSKLTQPGILVDEINQLKKDMDYLRKQNEFLKNFTKQSFRSFNQSPSSNNPEEEFKENFDEKSKGQYISNNSDVNNEFDLFNHKKSRNRFSTSQSMNLHKAQKKNKESIESQYHPTYQTTYNEISGNAYLSYRARKLSDSSSALMEDVKPKTWIETVPMNYNTHNNFFQNLYSVHPNHFKHQDVDQQSSDSYVTITTSITEKSNDEWNMHLGNVNGDNNDLLSTQDSDTYDYNAGRHEQKFLTKLRSEYSFTPKVPTDLNLEDIVKFVRPGGKMSTGRVCFIGHLPGRNEVCVGLELEEDAGKHDGLFEGVRYFQCRKNRGVFISFHKVILAYKSL